MRPGRCLSAAPVLPEVFSGTDRAVERWFIAGCGMVLRTENAHDPCVALTKAAKLLARASGIDELVAVLCEYARSVVGSDGIAVILREGERCRYVAEDAIEPLWRGQSFPLTECVSGWAMLHNRSVIVLGFRSRLIGGHPSAPSRWSPSVSLNRWRR